MKNMIYCSIILFIGLLSCQHHESTKLSNNLKIQEIFIEKEIISLNEILVYFDTLVKQSTGNFDIEKAYHSYCENLRYIPSNEFWERLKVNKLEIEQYVKNIENKEVFSELWIRQYSVDYESGDTLGSYLIQNMNGKYIELLNFMCEEYPEFNDYKEAVIDWKIIPPSLIAGFQSVHPKLDFNHEYIRLFVALHYMTLNTYMEKCIKINT